MSSRYNFYLRSEDHRRPLPPKVIIGQRENESDRHVLLKLLAYLLFFRERLQIEAQLHNDNIPFEPDLVQLDYELRPKFWAECGDCGVPKLQKLAVKVPEAEIWVLKPTISEAEGLLHAMGRAGLRKNRYNVLGLDPALVEELTSLLRNRNEVVWIAGDFEPPSMQFDFNGLWFDTEFKVWRF